MNYSEVKSCSLIFRYPTDEDGTRTYPKQMALVDMKSTTIPTKLVGLLHKKLEAHMEALSKEGKEHILAGYEFLDNIISNNNLMPCCTEIPQIKQIIDAEKGDTFKALEKAGKIKITLKEGKQYANVEFVVPPNYPLEMVKFQMKEHNFNQVFVDIFTSHTQGIIKRLWGGAPPGYDPKDKYDPNEGKIGYKKAAGKLEQDMAKISVATRAELKRDLDFLKQQKALQEGGMDKKTRKEFKLNLKHEIKYEEAKAAEVEEMTKLN